MSKSTYEQTWKIGPQLPPNPSQDDINEYNEVLVRQAIHTLSTVCAMQLDSNANAGENADMMWAELERHVAVIKADIERLTGIRI